jgi:hypothetical protein
MISQARLAEVQQLRDDAAALAAQAEALHEHPDVTAYYDLCYEVTSQLPKPKQIEACQELTFQVHAKQAEAAQKLEALKVLYKAKEPVEPGKWRISVKPEIRVDWKAFWMAVAAVPTIARAIANSKPAQELIKKVTDRDPSAPFVSEAVKSFDVVPAG